MAAVTLVGATRPAQSRFSPSADQTAALDLISSDSLRGHLSFIASDLLEGRDTPSPGLNLAAEYIAAQYRRSGIEPAGDDGFFQTANWFLAERDLSSFTFQITLGDESFSAAWDQVAIPFSDGLELSNTPIVKLASIDPSALASLTQAEIEGKVVIFESLPAPPSGRRAEMMQARNQIASRMRLLKAALVVSISRSGGTRAAGASRLIDPENRPGPVPPAASMVMSATDPRVIAAYDKMSTGLTPARLTLKLPPPAEKPVKLRNVIGVVRGSDPALRETCVLVTAHYDHLGIRAGGDGDRIFNGANDDGSGTVAVIELASAFARLKTRPKRSVVFMTFFGEERGLLGSRYYGRNPVFPVEKTVANINLEQVGRTDSTEGPQVATASLTGFDFSEVGEILKTAGELTGIKVYKHATNSDSYFGRSDNQALANLGVPAHTLCVAYNYPDYHGLGDHWEKVDYANMAKVVRMVGVGVLMIAENPAEPKWNESNPRTQRYVEAWKARRAAGK
jgi:hypothetical protein